MTAAATLTKFSDAIDRQDWPGLLTLLAPGFAGHYVHDGQRFDRDSFVAFNRAYPGSWRFRWVDVVDAGDRAVGRAEVADGTETYYVASFITVDTAGKITDLTEVWTDAVPATG